MKFVYIKNSVAVTNHVEGKGLLGVGRVGLTVFSELVRLHESLASLYIYEALQQGNMKFYAI